mgnify:CR=1 FL=1
MSANEAIRVQTVASSLRNSAVDRWLTLSHDHCEPEPELEPEAEPETAEPEAEPETAEPEAEPETAEPEAEPETAEPESEAEAESSTGRRRAAEIRRLQAAEPEVDANADCCGTLSADDTQLLLSALRILVDEHNSARAEPEAEAEPETEGEAEFGPEPEFLEQRMDVNDAISNFLGVFYLA